MSQTNAFVAREAEIERLGDLLQLAFDGQGQVAFVAGEAGSGKTALVNAFARRAGERHDDLIIAFGQSDAQTGIGDPYLPFRELLGQLTGDVETRLAQGELSKEHAGRLRQFLSYSGQAIVELGPDLIGIFLPGAGLATRAATFLAEKVGWLEKLEQLTARGREGGVADLKSIDQSHIFEQYTNVITHLAEKQPLLLIVDDLQWADAASIGLLFRLGRRLGGSRVLLLGTYRPAEVAIGRAGIRHPLEKVLAEFKRYFGDVFIDLEQTSPDAARYFVDAFLDSEPHRLGDNFRDALFDHTDGHALFTIELLRSLQERGDLVQDAEGFWVETGSLDWNALPARVEGVIEERIERLEKELEESLKVASVEGEEFTAEVVARVQDQDPRQLVRILGRDLEQQHRLVVSQGLRRLEPGGLRLSRFRFHHNLIQRYLYNHLSEADRTYLHEDVGTALETLCDACADEFVIQLARHFVEAGIDGKAAMYLGRAGELAAVGFAHEEARDYFSRALDLTPASRAPERYALLAAREKVLRLQGARKDQERDIQEMASLAEKLDDDAKRAEVRLRQSTFGEATGDYPAAVSAAKEAVQLAGRLQDVRAEASGYLQWGMALCGLGKHDEAMQQLECALALSKEAGLLHVEVRSLTTMGQIFSEKGTFAEASASYERALQQCERAGDLLGEASVLNGLAIIAAKQGDLQKAEGLFEQSLAIMQRVGERRGQGILLNNLANIAVYHDAFSKAMSRYQQCLAIHREVDDQRGECMSLGNLGAVSIKLGDFTEARTYLEESLAVSRKIGQQLAVGHGLASLSQLSHLCGEHEDACDYGRRALEIAVQVGDRWNEAHTWVRLGLGLEGLSQWAEAADAYRRALGVWSQMGQRSNEMEAIAGLARVALAEGDLAQALERTDRILQHLAVESLQGAVEPFRIYLTCYSVLRATDDRRARSVLVTAHTLLEEKAALVGDEAMSKLYLEAVPVHRAIREEFARSCV